MIKSMTGYGKASSDYSGKKITVEAKSINSKQLDISFRMPLLYKEKEIDMRNEVAKILDRGKVEIILVIDAGEKTKAASINSELVKIYFKQMQDIAKNLEINKEQDLLSIVMRLPEVIKTEQQEFDEEEWESILSLLKKALNLLDQARIKEGKTLEKDFSQRIKLIHQYLKEVEPFEKERIENIKNRIKNNLLEFVNSEKIDENRFEQELIFYLEKIDITEEKVRLENHLKYFEETLLKEEIPGKKLGFICQEIGREINTLGSKANDVNIQKLVIQMKDELEKIKEQLANVL